MNSKIKKNYLFSITYQIFAILVPIITTPYISRVLSVEGIGIYSYTYSIMRYFWLFSAIGISTLGVRTIGIYQDDRNKRTECFWNIMSTKILLSFIFIFLYYIYVFVFSDDKIISSIQGIYLFGVLLDITWLFQGMEDYKKITIRNILIKVLNILFIFLFIKKNKDLNLYIFGLAFFSVLSNFALWLSIKKYVNKFDIRKMNPFRYLKDGILLFIPSIATQIFAILDKSMIGYFTNSMIESGCYEQAFKIVDMSLIIITTISSIMIPKVAKNYSIGNKKENIKSIQKSFKFILLISIPMTIGMCYISSAFVPWFFGKGYEQAIYILYILSLLYIFMGINSITGTQCLISMGKYNIHSICLIIGGMINIFLNFILINKIGAIGAAIGSVVGEIIVSILEILYLQKNNILNIKFIFLNSKKIIIASFIMLVGDYFIKKIFYEGFFSIVILIISSCTIYLTSLILLKEKIVLNNINFIFNMKGNRV